MIKFLNGDFKILNYCKNKIVLLLFEQFNIKENIILVLYFIFE